MKNSASLRFSLSILACHNKPMEKNMPNHPTKMTEIEHIKNELIPALLMAKKAIQNYRMTPAISHAREWLWAWETYWNTDEGTNNKKTVSQKLEVNPLRFTIICSYLVFFYKNCIFVFYL